MIDLKVLTGPMIAATREIQKLDGVADRAVMWAIREAGRQTKRTARKVAPRYSGPDPRAVPGRLRASIKSDKRVRRYGPHEYGVKIGPRGPIAALYAQKIEEQIPYMDIALETVRPRVRAIHEAALARALLRYGP